MRHTCTDIGEREVLCTHHVCTCSFPLCRQTNTLKYFRQLLSFESQIVHNNHTRDQQHTRRFFLYKQSRKNYSFKICEIVLEYFRMRFLVSFVSLKEWFKMSATLKSIFDVTNTRLLKRKREREKGETTCTCVCANNVEVKWRVNFFGA